MVVGTTGKTYGTADGAIVPGRRAKWNEHQPAKSQQF